MTPPLPAPSPIATKAPFEAYDPVASAKLELAYLDPSGLNPDLVAAHLDANADPRTCIVCTVPTLPELGGFKISCLSASAFFPLEQKFKVLDRLNLMDMLMAKGASQRIAAGELLAMYSDVWKLSPVAARALMIGSHNLHLAVASKLER